MIFEQTHPALLKDADVYSTQFTHCNVLPTRKRTQLVFPGTTQVLLH